MFNSGSDKCACSDTKCVRHGKCKECTAYHNEKGTLTTCKRKKKASNSTN